MTRFFEHCLRQEFSRRIAKNARYSLRAFAKALDVQPSILSRAMNGGKTMTVATAQRIAERLAMAPEARAEFVASVGESQPQGRRRSPKAAKPARRAPVGLVDEDTFSAVADWHHYAILEATYLEDFRSDPAWIAARFGLTHAQVSEAIARLERLGLLTRTDGRLRKAEATIWTRSERGTTAALRRHHRQCLEMASVAVDEVPFERRVSAVMTMPADPAKLAQARAMIESFSLKVCRMLSSDARRDVYQLTVELFPLTKGDRHETSRGRKDRHGGGVSHGAQRVRRAGADQPADAGQRIDGAGERPRGTRRRRDDR
jgi:uncharacterized protein (TIGR02147 family)